MRMPAPNALRRGLRRLWHSVAGRTLILLYHRVADVVADPWQLCVSPQHFAEHLEILRHRMHPVRLDDMARDLRAGRCPRRAAIVTFDDGYADNLHNARPLLERYAVPATVFVATGYLDGKREFWWDELERVILGPIHLPQTLRLEADGRSHVWELGDAAHYPDGGRQQHRRWEAWGDEHPTARHALYRALYEFLLPISESDKRRTLDVLGAWAGVQPVARPTHRALTRSELRALADGELIVAGSHAVTHAALSSLAVSTQWEELRCSKTELERIIERPVTSFAYPYGKRCHYTAETKALVRQAGFTSACANVPGTVGRSADPFQLPRVPIQDWDGEAFSRALSAWLDR